MYMRYGYSDEESAILLMRESGGANAMPTRYLSAGILFRVVYSGVVHATGCVGNSGGSARHSGFVTAAINGTWDHATFGSQPTCRHASKAVTSAGLVASVFSDGGCMVSVCNSLQSTSWLIFGHLDSSGSRHFNTTVASKIRLITISSTIACPNTIQFEASIDPCVFEDGMTVNNRIAAAGDYTDLEGVLRIATAHSGTATITRICS